MDVEDIARALADLLYELDRNPGERIPILRRAAELEAMIDGIPYGPETGRVPGQE